MINKNNSLTRNLGTPSWMAPEVDMEFFLIISCYQINDSILRLSETRNLPRRIVMKLWISIGERLPQWSSLLSSALILISSLQLWYGVVAVTFPRESSWRMGPLWCSDGGETHLAIKNIDSFNCRVSRFTSPLRQRIECQRASTFPPFSIISNLYNIYVPLLKHLKG